MKRRASQIDQLTHVFPDSFIDSSFPERSDGLSSEEARYNHNSSYFLHHFTSEFDSPMEERILLKRPKRRKVFSNYFLLNITSSSGSYLLVRLTCWNVLQSLFVGASILSIATYFVHLTRGYNEPLNLSVIEYYSPTHSHEIIFPSLTRCSLSSDTVRVFSFLSLSLWLHSPSGKNIELFKSDHLIITFNQTPFNLPLVLIPISPSFRRFNRSRSICQWIPLLFVMQKRKRSQWKNW